MPSLDEQMPQMFTICEEDDLHIKFIGMDMWWGITLACKHGWWRGTSVSFHDPGTAMEEALEKAAAAHQPNLEYKT